MIFYFSWAVEDEPFDPTHHNREDLKVFSLVIEAQEGGFPMARLRIQNKGTGLGGNPNQQRAYISFQRSDGLIQPLFQGRLCRVPERIDGESYEIHLTAEPINSQNLLQKVCNDLKKSPYWDPLFVEDEEKDNPREVLEAMDSLFYWSRTEQKVALSNLFEGKEYLNIGENFIRDSLNIKMVELPLKGVRVRLKASWTQSFRGRTDITYCLRSKFPGGLINTLSGPDLKAKWWHEGERLGQSGYWVEESRLKEIRAPHTGVLGLYPDTSKEVWVSPDDPSVQGKQTPFQTRLKRFWYRSSLILGWRYRQKRREVAEFYLGHSVQPLGPNLEKVRTLNLTMYNLCLANDAQEWRSRTLYSKGSRVYNLGKVYESQHPHRSRDSFDQDKQHWVLLGKKPDISQELSRSSFFTTERGHRCIAHALDRARAHLAASARAVDIHFSTDFERVSGITCDHSISIRDKRLPGGEIKGKVKSYRLIANGKTGALRGEIVLSCAVGLAEGGEQRKEKNLSRYVSPSYCDGFSDASDVLVSPQGLPYQPFYHQQPTQGVVSPDRLTAYDLVEEVNLINGPEAQNNYLQENQYPNRHNIRSVLKEARTDIRVRLKDLRGQPAECHQIKVSVLSDWSAPCQIDLSAQ